MSSIRFDPQGPYMRHPLAPHQLRDRFTRTEDTIVLCHLGVPRIEPEQWSLVIDGMVSRPRTLRFEDLRRYRRTELESVHNCCGSPFKPLEPTRRISNVRWSGARLADVLDDCGLDPAARYAWSTGADFGEFGGVAVDAYRKDFPVSRIEAGPLIAYDMNGGPLLPEHGFPARLVLPGFYGTNSVKWLTRITLAERRATGPFTTHWYNDPLLDGAGRQTGATSPVWAIAPDSVIVSPAPEDTPERSTEMEIHGWAWADGGVRNVYVRTGESEVWQRAEVESPHGYQWQRFSWRWIPSAPGATMLACLAEGANGQLQPVSGRRNAIHQVPVTVT